MFTGIVQGTATFLYIKKISSMYYEYSIQMPDFLLKNIQVGNSISNNGCCLTVVKIYKNIVIFNLIQETFKKTNLKFLKKGDQINVERASKFGDEIGGHIVSGHIITTAQIINSFKKENTCTFLLKLKKKKIMKYIFYKGFICLDGVSLTVGKILDNNFYIHIIPETLLSTNFFYKDINYFCNVEIDVFSQTIVDTCIKFMKK
ncbi:riboflavin synthase subunit alpha [Buchnera aphidicola]|uniref:riboflavin synthase subunit alpha n=1 Tax=Buchnera aphidicola TaxID=9 RepID=UPI00223781CF|nr:riboflavin synthase subunit alpha [Buchnera aphidicola]MCW5197621.1 riboflavin synthase subunit alpha [Buchnera aphidicola (Chaitophorus viminalis)]